MSVKNTWGNCVSILVKLFILILLSTWSMLNYAGDPCVSDPESSACETSAGGSGGNPPGDITLVETSGANDSSAKQVFIPYMDGFNIPIFEPSKDRDGQYTISWSQASGVVSRYEYRESFNGTWGDWIMAGTSLNHTFSGQADGKYRYDIRAYNGRGYGGSRRSAEIIVEKDGRLPPIVNPVNSACTQSDWSQIGFSMESIYAPSDDVDGNYNVSFSWSQVPSGYKLTGVLIQESRNGSAFYDLDTVTIPGEGRVAPFSYTYEINGRPAANYRYRVQGKSDKFCGSNIKASNVVQVHGDKDAPASLSASSELSCNSGSLSVSWDSVIGSNQYQLQRSVIETDAIGDTINTSTWQTVLNPSANQSYFTGQNYTDSDIVQGGKYRYRVRSRFHLSGTQEQTGWSDWRYSTEVRKPFCVPDAPHRVTATTEKQYSSTTDSRVITHLDQDGKFWVQWNYHNTAQEDLVGYYEVLRYGTKVSPVSSVDRLLNKMYEVNEGVGGIYRYNVVACNVDGCSNPSDYLEVTVAMPAEPPSLPAEFDYIADPDVHASAIPYEGKLNGALSVSPSGAAGYSVPIAIPPATSGVAPKLSLDYSSQSGNGLLGVGWSLGGLSMITRCPKTQVQDQERGSIKYNAEDRFCLDGKRLTVVEGDYGMPESVYRTAIDSFDVVTGKGTKGTGPEWFEVKTKSGETLQFGNTVQSRIEAAEDGTISVWALNEVEDTVGNYYTVDYYNLGGEFYPTAFHYTGNANELVNPYTTVDLVYEDRPDKRTAYYRGSKNIYFKRLKKIVTDMGEYQLEYGAANDFQASRVDAIQYCDVNSNCPATRRLTFDWQINDGQEGWDYAAAEDEVPYDFVDENGEYLYTQLIDIDGDGNIEMITSKQGYTTSTGGSGKPGSPPQIDVYHPPELLILSSTGVAGAGWEPYPGPKPTVATYFRKNIEETMDAGVRFVDLDGNGFIDVLHGRGSSAGAWLHGDQKGDGWTASTAYASPEPFVDVDGQDRGTRVLDLNGDGLPDMIRMQYIDHATGHYRAWINNGHGWDASTSWVDDIVSIATHDKGLDEGVRFADINGDGLIDMMVRDGNEGNPDQRLTYINTGSDFERQSYGGYNAVSAVFVDEEGRDQGLRLADLNGDGLPDLMSAITGYETTEPYKTWINTGDGWIESPEYRAPMPFVQVFEENAQVFYDTYVDYGARLLDVNGDGLNDIVQRNAAGTGRVVLNTGTGWNEVGGNYRPRGSIVTSEEDTPQNYYDTRDTGVQFADINSDGQIDFVAESVNYNLAKPMLITEITDGLGNVQTVHYKPLTDTEVYLLEENAQGKHLHDGRMAMQVVYQVESPDGRGDPQIQEYYYKGLIYNTQGLGSYGFREIKQTDLTTNYYNVTEYSQTYPFVGMPVKTTSYTNNDDVITESENLVFEIIETVPTSTAYISFGNNIEPLLESEKIKVPYFLYIKESTSTIHHFNNNMEQLTSKVTTKTTNEYDIYGNSIEIITEVDDHQGNSWKTVTENDFTLDGLEHEKMGRLTQATVTKSKNNQTDENSIRVTAFDYDDVTHLLVKETVEAGRAEPNTLVTVYDHDRFGNRTSITVCAKDVGSCAVNSPGPTELPHRTTTTSYDPADYPSSHTYIPTSERGRFPVVTTNAKGHQESYRYDSVYGVVTEQTSPNGLSTCTDFDTWGRQIKQRSLCGSANQVETITEYHKASAHTEYAAFTITNYSSGRKYGTTTRTYFDSLGRKLRRQSRGFKGQIIYVDHIYDERGRGRKVSEPYFYSQDYVPVIHWNETKVIDDLGRVQEVLRPVGDISYDPNNGDLVGNPEPPVSLSTIYNGFETQTKDAKGRIKVTIKNAIGYTISTTDAHASTHASQLTYGYDSQGNLLTTTDHNNNVVILSYDIHGRKTSMTDPDLGYWQYDYNGFSEMIEQIDAKGQKTQIVYDTLGRMVARTDLHGTADAQTSNWIYDSADNGIGKMHQEIGRNTSKLYSYDLNGRLTSTTQTFTTSTDVGSFTTEWRYDELGRRTHVKYPEIDADTPRVWMNYQYNEFGFLHYMLDITDTSNPAGVVYWRADEVNARGQLEDERMRNRTRTQQYHNEANGWLDATFTMDSTTLEMDVPIEDNIIQHTHYKYDVTGNVKEKTGRANGLDNFKTDLTEHYSYDEHNRLVSTGISGYDQSTGSPFNVGEKDSYPARSYQYDVLGNITRKDGVGDYYYGSNCENGGAGPHAVCEIRSENIIMKSYQYDANGAMTHSYIGATANGTAERKINYNGFNKPSKIIDYSRNVETSAEFFYGPKRERILRIADEIKYDDENNEKVERERIAYIGNGATGGSIMERKINETTGKVTFIHFMYAGAYHNGQAFAMRVIEQQNGAAVYVGTEYYHRDHLGSVIAITDDTGLKRAYDENNQVTGGAQAFLKGYDAWGKRRNPDWSEAPTGESQYTSTRGHLSYTGQEAITGVGLIHMNGRVYDPELGRFLSADPKLQAPNYSQSYNRYTYVWNNPVNTVDPTGYIAKKILQAVDPIGWEIKKKTLTKISPNMATVISIGMNSIPVFGPLISAHFMADYAAINGASDIQVFRSYAVSVISSYIGRGIGNPILSGAVSGAFSGAMNADFAGENVRRGLFKGAARGAAMAALTWVVKNSLSDKVVHKPTPTKEAKEVSAVAVNHLKTTLDHFRINTSLDVDVSVEGDITTITIDATVIGNYPDSVNRFIEGVEAVWDGQTFVNSDGHTYQLKVNLVQPKIPLFGDIKLKFDRTRPPADGSDGFVSRTDYIGASSATMWIYDKDYANVSAHEFGHMMGFDDMYTKLPSGYTEALPGYENDIMGTIPASVQIYHLEALAQKYGR